MARFYTTSKGEFLKPFDPSDYGYAGTAKTTGSGTRSTAAPKLGDFEVLPQDVNALDSRMTDYQKRINDLTYQAQQDPKSIKALTPEMQKLSLEIGSDVRAGDIYHMLNRKSEYDRTVDTLKKVFKDRPDLLDAAIGAIEIPPLIDENGEYQQIRAPRVTDPWTSAREGALFKDAIAALKPKLQDSTDWQNVPAVSDAVTKYFEKEDIYGLNAKDIENTIISQLSPQDLLAITQEAELMGMDPEKVMKNFETRIRNFANSIAGVTDKKREKTTRTDYGKKAEYQSRGRGKGGGLGPGESWLADRLTNLYLDFDTIDLKDFRDYMPDGVTEEELRELSKFMPFYGKSVPIANPDDYDLTPRQLEIVKGGREFLTRNITSRLKDLTEAFRDQALKSDKNTIVQSFNYDPNAAPGEEVTVTLRTTTKGAGGAGGADDDFNATTLNPGQQPQRQAGAGDQVKVTTKPLTMGMLRNIVGQAEADKVYKILLDRKMISPEKEDILWKGPVSADATPAGATDATTTGFEPDLRFDANRRTDINVNGSYLVFKEIQQNLEDLGYVGDPVVDEETGETRYEYTISEKDIEALQKGINGINPLDPQVNLIEGLDNEVRETIKNLEETKKLDEENIATIDRGLAEVEPNGTYTIDNKSVTGTEAKAILETEKEETLKRLQKIEADLKKIREEGLKSIRETIGKEAVAKRRKESQEERKELATTATDSAAVDMIYENADDFSGDFLKSQNEDSKIPQTLKDEYPAAKDIPGYTFYGHISADKKEEEIASMGSNWNNMLSDTENYRIINDGKGGHFIFVKTQNTNQ